jgi:hypothetical protein
MSKLLANLDSVCVYLDNILHVTKGSWMEHLEGMDEIVSRLQSKGLKIKAKKSEYTISTDGIAPITKKVEALLAINIKQAKTCKQLRSFIAMINYYRDMWKGGSILSAPLTALTAKSKTFEGATKIID